MMEPVSGISKVDATSGTSAVSTLANELTDFLKSTHTSWEKNKGDIQAGMDRMRTMPDDVARRDDLLAKVSNIQDRTMLEVIWNQQDRSHALSEQVLSTRLEVSFVKSKMNFALSAISSVNRTVQQLLSSS